MLKVSCNVNDYSLPKPKECVVINSCGNGDGFIEIMIGNESRCVVAKEIISAIEKAELGILGR